MKNHVLAVWVLLLLSGMSFAGPTPTSELPSPQIKAQTESVLLSELSRQLKSVIGEVEAQRTMLSQQQDDIKHLSQKVQSPSTAILTAGGVVLAAMIAGFFAIRNQNRQAAQERLLKAIELIMDSRSGYQAEIRKQNLSVFLDPPTVEHLKDIKTNFSGPEFTDLHVGLAHAMAEKASSPEEVLRIWKAVLKEKNVFTRVNYP